MTIDPTSPRASDQLRSGRSFAALPKLVFIIPAIALGLGGCGDDDSGGNDAAAGGGTVEVSDAWARSSPPGVADGAAYVTIESAADDQLIGGSVPADVAASVELHETVTGDGEAVDDTAGHGTGSHGTAPAEGSGATMTMRQVSAVDLPAGQPVVFGPGGLHVMLVDLAGPLESGSSFELTLTFADAEPLTITVDVRDEAP